MLDCAMSFCYHASSLINTVHSVNKKPVFLWWSAIVNPNVGSLIYHSHTNERQTSEVKNPQNDFSPLQSVHTHFTILKKCFSSMTSSLWAFVLSGPLLKKALTNILLNVCTVDSFSDSEDLTLLLAYTLPGGNKSLRHLKAGEHSTQWRQYGALHWRKEQYCCHPAKTNKSICGISPLLPQGFIFFHKFSPYVFVPGLLCLFFSFQFYTTFHFNIVTLILYFTVVPLPGDRKMGWGHTVLMTTISHSHYGILFKLCSAHCCPTHPQTSQRKKTPDGLCHPNWSKHTCSSPCLDVRDDILWTSKEARELLSPLPDL